MNALTATLITVLLIVWVAALVFWVWTFWNMAKNERLNGSSKLGWTIAFIFLQIPAACCYFIEYQKKPRTVKPELPPAFDLFKPSWEGVKLNIVELIMVFLVPMVVLSLYFLIVVATAGIASNSSNSVSALGIVLLAVGVVAAVVYAVLLGPALVHIQLKCARMQKVTYETAWATSKKFWWRYLILSIAVGLTIVVGFLLFIIPGFIFLRRYFLSSYALIDQDLSTGDSMRVSSKLSRGRPALIFGVLGVDILIVIPNFIPFIGSFITFVLQIAYFCAPAIRYDQLRALKPVVSKS